jgi:hypothetical protein
MNFLGTPKDDGDRAERAAILEYCAGFSRQEAERRAGFGNVFGIENLATDMEGTSNG